MALGNISNTNNLTIYVKDQNYVNLGDMFSANYNKLATLLSNTNKFINIYSNDLYYILKKYVQ